MKEMIAAKLAKIADDLISCYFFQFIFNLCIADRNFNLFS